MSTQAEHEVYYVPERSKLAICASISLALIVVGGGSILNAQTYGTELGNGNFLFMLGLFSLIATLTGWFRTTIKENLAGMNSAQLKRSYVMGMQWFIFSEVMFFAAFFGALLYVRTLAGPWLAGDGAGAMNHLLWGDFKYEWPPMATPQEVVGLASQTIANNGIFTSAKEILDPWHLPLINTILLVTSSVTLHFSHVALKADKRSALNWWLGLTLILGFVFVGVQAFEYYEAYTHVGLTLKSGVYGSTFFLLTGFHGLHVCLGAFMLTVQWFRSVTKKHFTKEDHFGFEASSWYWHFVDVVWIGLFVFVYII